MDLETIKFKIRKNKDIIHVNGYGVLVFMLWSLIKIILYLVDVAPEISPGVDDNLDTIYLSLTISISIIEDVLAILTGLLAIRVGKRNDTHYVSLIILSLITFLLSLDFVVGDILLCAVLANSIMSTIAVGIISDILFLTMTLSLTIAAYKLRKLTKEANIDER